MYKMASKIVVSITCTCDGLMFRFADAFTDLNLCNGRLATGGIRRLCNENAIVI